MNGTNIISIIVAITTAISSLIVAGLSYFIARRNAHDLEALKAELVEKQAEKNARRDYEYEARKRLYQQYEPLLFQLVERSESAFLRICSIARSARQGNVGTNHEGWFSPNDYYYSYYLTSTVYMLLAPFVIVKLIQRLLTLVDLTVDPHINNQYLLAKWLYISLTDDFKLSRIAPILEYDPNTKEWRKKRAKNPQKYWRQGIFMGRLDNLIETLIIREPNGSLRCMSYGEFEEIYKAPNMHGKFEPITELFTEFHPKTRPVLWRILITQAHIYEALLRTRELKLSPSDSNRTPELLKPITERDRLKFDWRQTGEETTDQEVLSQPFEVAQAYLRDCLGSMFAT